MFYKASAPGSLLLLGEYAVLSGNPGIACAIDKRLRLTLTPRKDKTIQIHSTLGMHETRCGNIDVVDPFTFLLAGLRQHRLEYGCNINIESDINPSLGLGSSAALVACLTHVIAAWRQEKPTIDVLWQRGMQTIQTVQGRGSGADLAASLHGGLIHFTNDPFQLRPLKAAPPLFAVYSGSKLTTQSALQRNALYTGTNTLDEQSNDLVKKFEVAAGAEDWARAGNILTQGHELAMNRGICTDIINEIERTLLEQPSVCGIKISGAGFGDCLVGLGQPKPHYLSQAQKECGCRELNIEIDNRGVIDESKTS